MISRTRIVVIAGALALPLIAMIAWHAFEKSTEMRDEMVVVLAELGYVALVPPSRLFGPGTINTLEKLPNGSLQMHPACTMDMKLLTALWMESETIEQKFAKRVENSFSASTKAARFVIADATGKKTMQVNASLQDMRIITMSHEDLIKIRGMYLRGSCEEAILLNLRSGAEVCQTASVIQADVAYRMSYADGLETTDKLELAKQAAASFGVTMDESGMDVMRGDNLYYGVKHNKVSCFKLPGTTDRFRAASDRTGAVVR